MREFAGGGLWLSALVTGDTGHVSLSASVERFGVYRMRDFSLSVLVSVLLSHTSEDSVYLVCWIFFLNTVPLECSLSKFKGYKPLKKIHIFFTKCIFFIV